MPSRAASYTFASLYVQTIKIGKSTNQIVMIKTVDGRIEYAPYASRASTPIIRPQNTVQINPIITSGKA